MKKRYVVAGILAAAGLICGGIAYYQYYQDAHAGQEYEKIKEMSIHNPDAKSMTLGKYFDGTIESGSYVARAEETGDTYFSLGTMWDEIEEMYGLTDKEMFDLFNTKALDDAVLSDKVIRFGQDPREWSETALGDEWNYLKSRYNYTGLLENGGYWYAIK